MWQVEFKNLGPDKVSDRITMEPLDFDAVIDHASKYLAPGEVDVAADANPWEADEINGIIMRVEANGIAGWFRARRIKDGH